MPNNHYGELMEKGDVIGVLFEKNEKNEFYSLSFSRNGKNFGVAYDDIQFKNNMRFVAHLGFQFYFNFKFLMTIFNIKL